MKRSLMALLAALVVGGCGDRVAPGTCERDEECPAGQRCDLDTGSATEWLCVDRGDGGAQDALVGDGGADVAEGMEAQQVLDAEVDGQPWEAEVAVAVDAAVDAVVDAVVDAPREPECRTAAGCAGKAGRPICNLAGECVGCMTNPECAARGGGTPYCHVASGECVACLQHSQCPAGTPLCSAERECKKCNEAGGSATCAMREAARPVCDAGTGTCEICLMSSQCGSATAPICREKRCVGCRQDSECAARNGADPGLCLEEQGGRCATSAQVLYVRNATGMCTNVVGAGGTAATPYCHPQTAVDLATSERNVVLVRGPTGVFGFTASGTPASLTVVGQSGAAIAGGAAPGVTITGGQVYLRGFTIRSSDAEGIRVTGATTNFKGERLTVTGNMGGGIYVDGAAFDISNAIVAGNGPGLDGATSWGGLLLKPGAGTKRLANVTVVNNNHVGIACSGAVTGTGVISFGNLMPQITPTCMITACCSGDPQLTASFRLTSGSPCRNQVPPNQAPVLDIDGQVRPNGALADCGADEYFP